MVFLNPAVLFGLLAASIPVVIHLLNLRKLKKIEFSTLAFLKELQKTKIRRIKLKQWILLALRILIILLLVAAFARPTIKSFSIGGTASAAKTSAVIILDDTYSMSVVTDNGSYLNRAKQTAKSLLGEFQEGDEVSIILLSNEKKLDATSNFTSAKNFIDETEISFTGGTIHNSLIKAAQILSESKNFNKEIYLLSDFQKTELKNAETTLSDLSDLIPSNIRIYTFDFASEEPANLALTDFKVNNQIFEIGKLINFSASVKNTSDKSFNNSVVSLFINGN
ncbi:MAG: VWA domain-containing protein, partial [Melioribacteraceae bacterium]